MNKFVLHVFLSNESKEGLHVAGAEGVIEEPEETSTRYGVRAAALLDSPGDRGLLVGLGGRNTASSTRRIATFRWRWLMLQI